MLGHQREPLAKACQPWQHIHRSCGHRLVLLHSQAQGHCFGRRELELEGRMRALIKSTVSDTELLRVVHVEQTAPDRTGAVGEVVRG